MHDVEQRWRWRERGGVRGAREPLGLLQLTCNIGNTNRLLRTLRKAAERSVDGLWNAIGNLLDLFPPAECANYLANSGYPRSA